MINVLEHIDDDEKALATLGEALTADGVLCLFVPAFELLYSDFDRRIGHHRRYRTGGIDRKLSAAGLEPVHTHYMNALGFGAWFVTPRVARATRPRPARPAVRQVRRSRRSRGQARRQATIRAERRINQPPGETIGPMTAATRPAPRPRTRADHSTATIVGASLLLGVVLRLVVVLGPAGVLNSDEAFTGLIARSVTEGSFLWIFPGQSYQGTLEGFVVAPIQWILGPSRSYSNSPAPRYGSGVRGYSTSPAGGSRARRPGLVFALVWLWSSSVLLLSSTSLVGYGSGLALCAFGWWAWSKGANDERAWHWMTLAGIGFGAAVWQQPTSCRRP